MNPNDKNWLPLNHKVLACNVGYTFGMLDLYVKRQLRDLRKCIRLNSCCADNYYIYVDDNGVVKSVLSLKDAKRAIKLNQL